MTRPPLVCRACPRTGRIFCRGCGRRLCKHFTNVVTTPEGGQYDPLRDPTPTRLLGTCPACRKNS